MYFTGEGAFFGRRQARLAGDTGLSRTGVSTREGSSDSSEQTVVSVS